MKKTTLRSIAYTIAGAFLCLPGTAFPVSSIAQTPETPVQTIKGNVRNAKTQQPVVGATVRVLSTKLGARSAADGAFRVERVPVGRHSIQVSCIGYEPIAYNVVVTSGKEEILTVELVEQFIEMEEITVSGSKGSFTPVNEAALISSAVFSVDDVERFAGSRGDPARMAQNFAGVLGANDQRNDIIIRGGSPTELLWRLDGLDIPNPNHFATQGATGGPISAVNSNLLDNSDFLTGAFPAEYGDKLSGVFDLRSRKGNSDRYEFLGQFGFNGFEFMAEGPVPGVKGSFIANYRKSFLDIMESIGIKLGWAGIPRYQDATFKFDAALSDNDQISVTGLLGISDIDIKNSKLDTVYTGDVDIQNGTDIASLGITWQHLFSEKVYSRLLLGTVYARYRTGLDSITTDNDNKVLSLTPWFDAASTEGYHTARYTLSYAATQQHYITGGVESRLRYYSINEERYTAAPFAQSSDLYKVNTDGSSLQLLSFANWNWRITELLTSNIGVHTQYLGLNQKFSVEPRFSLSWAFQPRHSLTLGVSMHRQSQPLPLYFSAPGNKDVDFTQAIHYVAGYSFQPLNDVLLKVEGYYKDVSNAPVERDSATSYSFLNAGATFGSATIALPHLASTGKGKTYGAELTLTKHFSSGYYVTATGSLVRQEYTGSDGVWRFGAFDNQFIFNVLAGYEWKVSPTFAIEFSGKYTMAGGPLYTPIDLETSRKLSRTYEDESRRFTQRHPDYSRLDVKIDFRQDFSGFSIISFLTVENLLNTKNVQEQLYNPRNDNIQEVYQLGVFPVGGFKIEF